MVAAAGPDGAALTFEGEAAVGERVGQLGEGGGGAVGHRLVDESPPPLGRLPLRRGRRQGGQVYPPRAGRAWGWCASRRGRPPAPPASWGRSPPRSRPAAGPTRSGRCRAARTRRRSATRRSGGRRRSGGSPSAPTPGAPPAAGRAGARPVPRSSPWLRGGRPRRRRSRPGAPLVEGVLGVRVGPLLAGAGALRGEAEAAPPLPPADLGDGAAGPLPDPGRDRAAGPDAAPRRRPRQRRAPRPPAGRVQQREPPAVPAAAAPTAPGPPSR